MKITVGKEAGFCFGVSHALNTVYNSMKLENICTYGPIIHNKQVVEKLLENGVSVISDIKEANGRTVVIRAHGVPKSLYEEMDKASVKYIDATCVKVKNIQQIVQQEYEQGKQIIIAGNPKHPEIISINGFCENTAIIFETPEEAKAYFSDTQMFDAQKKYSMVVQTTFIKEVFSEILDIIKKSGIDVDAKNTICLSTKNRQEEADELSKASDVMLVFGDKQSSNSKKLYEICKKNCERTLFIETIDDLLLYNFNSNDKISITAGASTPPETIKGAIDIMNHVDNNFEEALNMQTFEQMLDDSFITLHTGDIVTGTVIQVVNGEVSVNLGYKSDGIIPRNEFSDDPTVEPEKSVKAGDEIEVFVVRVNDGDGNVMLSKKKIEANKGYALVEAAFNDKTPISGRIVDVIKGGLLASIQGVRVFVPSSQISNRFVEDLTQFKGKEFNFNIIEFDRQKRRIVAGRKALAAVEQKEAKERVLNSLEVGQRLTGTVSRITTFGAFVDLGGVDGLVHVSELSWGRVTKVSDVLKEGDSVVVTVLGVDKEKGKISLSLKDINSDPWANIEAKYPAGKVVSGKVVRMVPFGVFVELEEGLDGLVHISQIANEHVEKPQDVLKTGDVIEVKVLAVDAENKRVSLSKKAAEMPETEASSQEENAEVNAELVEE